MITTVADMVTNVPIHRLLGHTDNVKTITVKDGDIRRDILKDMLPPGQRGNVPMQTSIQLDILKHPPFNKGLLSVHMTTECILRANRHFGGETIKLRFSSISCMDHHLSVIQV